VTEHLPPGALNLDGAVKLVLCELHPHSINAAAEINPKSIFSSRSGDGDGITHVALASRHIIGIGVMWNTHKNDFNTFFFMVK
jgi:hypothetical protein